MTDPIQTQIDNLLDASGNIVNKIKEDLKDDMNDYIDEVENIIEEYAYYKSKMNERTDKNEKAIATNDRKSFYESQEYDNLIIWNSRFKRIYYIFSIILIAILFLSKNEIGFYLKIGISILLLVYPYIIYYILLPLVYIYKFIYGLIPKNVYNTL